MKSRLKTTCRWETANRKPSFIPSNSRPNIIIIIILIKLQPQSSKPPGVAEPPPINAARSFRAFGLCFLSFFFAARRRAPQQRRSEAELDWLQERAPGDSSLRHKKKEKGKKKSGSAWGGRASVNKAMSHQRCSHTQYNTIRLPEQKLFLSFPAVFHKDDDCQPDCEQPGTSQVSPFCWLHRIDRPLVMSQWGGGPCEQSYDGIFISS